MVSSYKDNHLKMLIKGGTELRVPIWHSGTREAFLIHMGSAQEAIKKKGYFKSFEDHSGTYADKREKVKELKTEGPVSGIEGGFCSPAQGSQRDYG